MRRTFLYIVAILVVVFASFLVVRESINSKRKNVVVENNIVKENQNKQNGTQNPEIKKPLDFNISGVDIDERFQNENPQETELSGWIKNLELAKSINENAGKILENRAKYSDALLKLASNRVDAINFVYYTNDYKNRYVEDYSESFALDRKFPLYIQWDPRFGYKYYDEYFACVGCGPTCVSMIVNGFGEKKTPIDIMEEMVNNKAYISGVGTSWDGILRTIKAHGLNANELPLMDNKFRDVIDNEGAVLLSMKPGQFTTGGHFLILIGIDENGNYLMNDPNSVRNSKKAWSYDEFANDIKGCWSIYK